MGHALQFWKSIIMLTESFVLMRPRPGTGLHTLAGAIVAGNFTK